MIKNVAIILAGGLGERAAFSRPKQLIKLAGRPVISHTIDRFQEHPDIHEIAIVTNSVCIAEIEALVCKQNTTKVKKLLIGGEQRHESSIAAIRAYEAEANSFNIRLIFHDAVRPLLSSKIISDVLMALNHYRAVDVTIPATDTVVVADIETNTIHEIPDRRLMHLGQTPQGFVFKTIKTAYDLALRDPDFRTTDDCGVVLKYLPEEKIYLVRGALNNVKLTYSDDLLIIDKFMQTNAGRRLEATADSATLSALRGLAIVIFGGASGIGASMARIAQAFGATVHVASRSSGVDIANGDAVNAYLQQAARKSGRIDAIVNCAAILNRLPLVSMSALEIAESIQANFLGAANIARFGFEHLKNSTGHLLMFASSSYTYGRALYSLYSASKAAIVNLTQALADEWADHSVRVNCVSPERTRTEMRLKSFGAEPADALLDPDDVARKALRVLLMQSTGFIYDINKI